MRYGLAVLLATFFLFATSWAAERMEMKTETQKINYSVGYQIGKDFRNQEVALDPEALIEGLRDGLGAVQPKLTEEEMHSTLVELKRKIQALEEERKKARAEKFRAEGKAFLEENAKKEGIVTLPSGLQYAIIEKGTGQQPTLEDTVTIRYHGTPVGGDKVDNSQIGSEPVTIALANVIPGWKEALPLMKEGAKWRLFVPPDLAFGERGPLGDRTIIYDVELLDFNPQQPKE